MSLAPLSGIAALGLICGALVGAASSGRAAEPSPGWSAPILVYHRFDPARPDATTVTLSTFEQQLDWLSAHGYAIAPLKTVLAELDGQAPAPAGPQAVITVDDGHRSVYTQLFPLIRARKIPVTLFIYPSAISNASYAMTWDELREMQASGLVEVQSHTYWHPNFKTERRRLSPDAYQAFVDLQLKKSKATLETRMGRSVTVLAWPFGVVDQDLEAAARRAGYVGALAYEGGSARAGDDVMALPRIPIVDGDRGARFAAKLGAARAKAAQP